jgi:uncharacterized protein (DUF2225 family)
LSILSLKKDKKKQEEQQKKITFFSRDALACPLCQTTFHKEELLSGSGRLIAGTLTEELRRNYEPSKKFGMLYPLIYQITVCPQCFYATFAGDFTAPPKETVERLVRETKKRKEFVTLLFRDLDFTKVRELKEGTASYCLAVACYDSFNKHFSPTVKQAIASLRAAWLFADLHGMQPNENFDYLSRLFYDKARAFYYATIEKEQKGLETVGTKLHLGPDIDKNYGYDGVLYLTGLLEFKYGSKSDLNKRLANLDRARLIISRVHGMGKISKDKPSTILEKAKDIFALISEEKKAIQEKLGLGDKANDETL